MVRAGVGSVLVADDDIMAYHNIARHECGIHDVGRYKVDCFKERAADINQDCKVYTFRDLIQHIDPEMLEESIWKDSVIICCADNSQGLGGAWFWWRTSDYGRRICAFYWDR